MPIYEYRCNACHQVFEEWVKHIDGSETAVCPVCDGEAERIMSNTSFVLKGDGWYVTDYGFKKGAKAEGAGTPQSPAAPAAGDSAAPAPAPAAPAAPAASAAPSAPAAPAAPAAAAGTVPA